MATGSEPTATERLTIPARVAIVTSGYHAELTTAMAASARETLTAAGAGEEDLVPIQAPGAFELPLLAQAAAKRRDIDAVLCFGLVLKGETEHDRHIAGAVAEGLTRVGLATEKPVLFGVLTCGTIEQAQARARRASEGGLDKGAEVARACVAALNTLAALRGTEETR